MLAHINRLVSLSIQYQTFQASRVHLRKYAPALRDVITARASSEIEQLDVAKTNRSNGCSALRASGSLATFVT